MKKSTTAETNKQDNRSAIAELIKQISGQNNTLAIPRIYIKLTGDDHLAALLLSQCVYWSDKGHSDGGWFAKSYQEWYEELGMTRYQVKRAAAKLEAFGLMTGLHRSTYHKGGATLHYRVDIDLLINLIVNLLDNQQTSQSDLQQTSISHLQESRKSDHRVAETTKDHMSPDGDAGSTMQDSTAKPVTIPRNALFDIIAARSFNLPAGTSISKAAGGRIGKAVSAVKALGVTADDMEAFYRWYAQRFPNTDAPRDGGKLAEHVLAWRAGKNKSASLALDSSVAAAATIALDDIPDPLAAVEAHAQWIRGGGK